MEVDIISTELLYFELIHVRLFFFCIAEYGVCVISPSYIFQWIFLKPCILVVNILKMCMWVFDGARINSDKIMAF